MPDLGEIPIGGPVVGDQPGLWGDGAEHKGVKFRLAKALDHLEPGAPRVAAVDFDRAGDQHLADPAAAGGPGHPGGPGADRGARRLSRHPTAEAPAATRTDKPFRPTPLEKVLRTRAFRRKAVLKFDQRPRKPSLRSRHHPTPAHPDTDEQLTAQFSFCTLNLDWPDARAYALGKD